MSNFLNKSLAVKTETVRCTANQTKKSGSKQKKRKIENPRRAQSFNEPSCFARTNSHDVGTRTKKPVTKTAALRSRANQTKKKRKQTKKSAKVKIQEERKASTNLLALQEQIPTTWEHGPKNWSENRGSAVQSKPDRKKATASQASEQRSGKNSPERRRQQREEKQTNSEKILCYYT